MKMPKCINSSLCFSKFVKFQFLKCDLFQIQTSCLNLIKKLWLSNKFLIQCGVIDLVYKKFPIFIVIDN